MRRHFQQKKDAKALSGEQLLEEVVWLHTPAQACLRTKMAPGLGADLATKAVLLVLVLK